MINKCCTHIDLLDALLDAYCCSPMNAVFLHFDIASLQAKDFYLLALVRHLIVGAPIAIGLVSWLTKAVLIAGPCCILWIATLLESNHEHDDLAPWQSGNCHLALMTLSLLNWVGPFDLAQFVDRRPTPENCWGCWWTFLAADCGS